MHVLTCLSRAVQRGTEGKEGGRPLPHLLTRSCLGLIGCMAASKQMKVKRYLILFVQISVDVKDPFINEGAVVKHFQKCVNIHLSEGQLVRNRGFGSRRYSGRNFDAACKRAQAQVLQNVRDQQEKVRGCSSNLRY